MSTLHLSRRATLLNTAISFTHSCFSTPPPDLLSRYFIPTNPRVTEHGPAFARGRLPFLSKTFTGRDEFLEYFQLLSEVLAFEGNVDEAGKVVGDVWPGEEGYAVDVDAVIVPPESEGANSERGRNDKGVVDEQKYGRGVVVVTGTGRFRSVKTGKSWVETFMHRFSGFDEEGRVGWWEIWADPLSAWTAVGH